MDGLRCVSAVHTGVLWIIIKRKESEEEYWRKKLGDEVEARMADEQMGWMNLKGIDGNCEAGSSVWGNRSKGVN